MEGIGKRVKSRSKQRLHDVNKRKKMEMEAPVTSPPKKRKQTPIVFEQNTRIPESHSSFIRLQALRDEIEDVNNFASTNVSKYEDSVSVNSGKSLVKPSKPELENPKTGKEVKPPEKQSSSIPEIFTSEKAKEVQALQFLWPLAEEPMFIPGTMVEVSYMSKSMNAIVAWVPAMIIKVFTENDEYKYIVKGNEARPNQITVGLRGLRPTPLPFSVEEYQLMEYVEVFHDKGWQQGRVIKTLSQKKVLSAFRGYKEAIDIQTLGS